MNLHEYQTKQLFAEYGIPVLPGETVTSAAEAAKAASTLGGNGWVVKAQVHAGGRGKAGGVKLAHSVDELEQTAGEMLGSRLVTKQTGKVGLPINTLLVEPLCNIEKELYMSALVDRARRRVTFMASEAGGMDIEEVAATEPEKIFKISIDPILGLMPYQGRQMGFALGLSTEQIRSLTAIMDGLYRLFTEKDASLVEINPLIITGDGALLALDAKMNVDDNALFRQKQIDAMRDLTQEDEKERLAQAHQLNYISLGGSIGCMVNGAGLAMATMDLIKLHGGEPANFLDVGGGTTPERVAEAFKLILSDEKVNAVLVNIFGGIVRCDLIAEGIINAVQEVHVNVPVVVRLEGTNVDRGRALLEESGLSIVAADTLTDAANKVVKAALGGGQS
jgi:succinyl-CoA synthetase beta subunit